MNREAFDELLFEYADAIDSERFDDWLELFTEDARYEVVPRENVEQNLPAALILCTSKDMLRDRIVSLRNANEYNLHYDRHLVGRARIRELSRQEWRLDASFAVFQSTLEGQSKLFCVGRYEDRVRSEGGSLRFAAKRIVIDSFSVPTLLATPL